MANKTVFITSGTTFNIPSDFLSLVSIECIGAGGGGDAADGGTTSYGGGGGGAYAKITSLAGLTAGGSANVSVGTGGIGGVDAGSGGAGGDGGNTWFSVISGAPTTTAEGVLAAGGLGTPKANTGSAGGTTAASIGDTKFAGGKGGDGRSVDWDGAGGGGAGGLHGTGAAGGTTSGGGFTGGAGGGASDAGSVGSTGGSVNAGVAGGAAQDATAGGAGGVGSPSAPTVGSPGSHGSGGGGGGGSGTVAAAAGGAGGPGIGYIQTSDSAVAGPGGGGGGGGGCSGAFASGAGGAGGLYGGGGGGSGQTGTATAANGGAGANGVIIFTYTPRPREWYLAEGLTENSTTSNSAWTTQATLTFTPKASTDYVIFWSGALQLNSTTDDGQADLYDVTNATELVLQNIEAQEATTPIDYVGVGGMYFARGGFMRPTNLISQSDFVSGWTPSGHSSFTTNANVAPDGNTTAARLIENSSAGPHETYQSLAKAASAIEYWFSVFVKRHSGSRHIRIPIQSGSGGTEPCINLTSGVFDHADTWGSFVFGETFVDAFPNGWYHCGVRFTSDTVANLNFGVRTEDAGFTSSFTGDGSSGLQLWHARLALATNGHPRVMGTGSHSFAMRFKSETNGVTTKMKNARLVALELTADDTTAEALSRTTTTSTTLQTKATASLTVPTGGGTYLCAISFNGDQNTVNLPCVAAMTVDGANTFSRISDGSPRCRLSPSDTTNRLGGLEFCKRTLTAGSRSVVLGYSAKDGGTAGCEQARVLMLRLDDGMFGENFYAEQIESTTGSASYADVATTGSQTYAGGDYLIMGFVEGGLGDSTISAYGQVLLDATTLVEGIRESASGGDKTTVTFSAATATLSAGSHTLAVQKKNESGTVTHESSGAVIAIKLPDAVVTAEYGFYMGFGIV